MEDSKHRAQRKGMAIFAVLSLMVVFTVLGVAAITIAQRDNASSGNVLDIKQRESAAYAGLVYAQSELTRDPANLLDMLESWRTKALYASPTGPFGRVYLKFDSTAKVSLTLTDPGMYKIPGSSSKIKVEVIGITVPSASEEPRIALRSTGSSTSGDEQTILGVYQIKNIRMNSISNVLPINHPFYVSGAGSWNSPISISNGNAYLGNKTHLNGSVTDVNLKNAGLRVYGDFELDNIRNFNADSNVYVNGNFLLHGISGTMRFRQNIIVAGNLDPKTSGALLNVDSSLYIMGSTGIGPGKQAIRLNIGKDFFMPNGNTDLEDRSWIQVTGSAFLRQLRPDDAKKIILDVGRRLELSGKGGLLHRFQGIGKWGQLVVREAAATSSFRTDNSVTPISGTRIADGMQLLGIPHSSWIGTTNLSIGDSSSLATRLHMMQFSPTPPTHARLFATSTTLPIYMNYGLTGAAATINLGAPPTVSTAVNADGFDTSSIWGPIPLAKITKGAPPPHDTANREPSVDMLRDPAIVSKAWVPTASSSCETGKLCGKAIQEAYDADIVARTHFYNGYFVVRLNGDVMLGWDAIPASSPKATSPLRGKYFFYVDAPNGGMNGSQVWPTTAANLDTLNPKNVMFVYGRGTRGKFLQGFKPQSIENSLDSITFTGYVRYDDSTLCPDPTNNNAAPIAWTPGANTIFRGAFHLVGIPGNSRCTNLNINSNANYGIRFNFDPAALNSIGSAFGTIFIKTDGTPVGPPPGQFILLENWVQLRTMGELR